jgi:hypothetical protein
MTLGRRQEIFSEACCLLEAYARMKGYTVRRAWGYRDAIAAKRLGFERSLHTKKLAQDYDLFLNNRWQKKTEQHAELGVFWKSLSGTYEGTRLEFTWGGDFVSNPDGNHYSLRYQNVS